MYVYLINCIENNVKMSIVTSRAFPQHEYMLAIVQIVEIHECVEATDYLFLSATELNKYKKSTI